MEKASFKVLISSDEALRIIMIELHVQLVGAACGQHGQYTFYKAIRVTSNKKDRILAIGDFFFVRIWPDSELVSIGELQLLWTDRVSDQTLVSLRLYFLPENTPMGRNNHGEDEVLALNEKVVLRAEDLLTWMCSGTGWRYGLRAVWRGDCVPPAPLPATSPLHHTKLDFSDIDKEKSTIEEESDAPGVVVFSYPRYCRYRALLARLEGMQNTWLRHSIVAALGGYAARTTHTTILYCKDTFEYPELEGHEFVCNHLAPRLKGRPRGRRKRAPRSRSQSPDSRSSDTDHTNDTHTSTPVKTQISPRRLSLRNGASDKASEEDEEVKPRAEERLFLAQLRHYYKGRGEELGITHALKHLSLRALYEAVTSKGGYEAVCRNKLWRSIHQDRPARVRSLYERYLLSYETHCRRQKLNGALDAPIQIPDSPLRPENTNNIKEETKAEVKAEVKGEAGGRTAEQLNKEFLDSLPKEEKPLISVKPPQLLIDPDKQKQSIVALFAENKPLVSELCSNLCVSETRVLEEVGGTLSDVSARVLRELAGRLSDDNPHAALLKELTRAHDSSAAPNSGPTPGDSGPTLGEKCTINGHTPNGGDLKSSRPLGRSSLRAVRVKPTRIPHSSNPHTPLPSHPHHTPTTTPPTPLVSDSTPSVSPPQPPAPLSAPPSMPSAPPLTNFGINPPVHSLAPPHNSDDEIVEVPYKPKSPEIIDLDEYPESPQASKKKKLDILKERGLEVTVRPAQPHSAPLSAPISGPLTAPLMLNPLQHQIMAQASLFQMYSIMPQNYANGIQPPRVIQSSCLYGHTAPEKIVYGNPKDPFMPPPHILLGSPIKPQKTVTEKVETKAKDILDLTCKNISTPSQKPAVEIVRIPTAPSPSKNTAQNLTKNYNLIDGKAVVGSNLEITLVSPKSQTSPKNKLPQKRSSTGKFMSTKTPTPPKDSKDFPKNYPSPGTAKLSPNTTKKNPINIPTYQISKDEISPTSSTGSRDSQQNLLQNVYKQNNLAQMIDMQKLQNLPQNLPNLPHNMMDLQNLQNLQNIQNLQKSVPLSPFIDPMYMSAIYSSLTGQMDQRQLAMYRDLMANQFRYSGLLGATPTTKN